jgi:hypothetical protein
LVGIQRIQARGCRELAATPELAKLGLSKRRVEDQQKYIERLEDRLGRMQRRIAAWKPAKANLEANDTLFLSFGSSHPESFGKLLDRKSCHSLVTTAIAKATKYLFGETKHLTLMDFGILQSSIVSKFKAILRL